MNIQELIENHEGVRYIAYKDSLGIQTVGVGHNLSKPLSRKAVEQIRDDDIADAIDDCKRYDWFGNMSEVRQAVVVDMMFNLGYNRFSKFKQTIRYISEGNYEKASKEMLDSVWAKQVGKRANELSTMFETDKWPNA